jgi:hypothetical protein
MWRLQNADKPLICRKADQGFIMAQSVRLCFQPHKERLQA